MPPKLATNRTRIALKEETQKRQINTAFFGSEADEAADASLDDAVTSIRQGSKSPQSGKTDYHEDGKNDIENEPNEAVGVDMDEETAPSGKKDPVRITKRSVTLRWIIYIAILALACNFIVALSITDFTERPIGGYTFLNSTNGTIDTMSYQTTPVSLISPVLAVSIACGLAMFVNMIKAVQDAISYRSTTGSLNARSRYSYSLIQYIITMPFVFYATCVVVGCYDVVGVVSICCTLSLSYFLMLLTKPALPELLSNYESFSVLSKVNGRSSSQSISGIIRSAAEEDDDYGQIKPEDSEQLLTPEDAEEEDTVSLNAGAAAGKAPAVSVVNSKTNKIRMWTHAVLPFIVQAIALSLFFVSYYHNISFTPDVIVDDVVHAVVWVFVLYIATFDIIFAFGGKYLFASTEEKKKMTPPGGRKSIEVGAGREIFVVVSDTVFLIALLWLTYAIVD